MTDKPPLLETLVDNASGDPDVDAGFIAQLLAFAYSARRRKPASLALLVTDDREIARLNFRHLRREGPTDVLAFEDGEVEDGRVRLGDVAISAETARRVAAERDGKFEHELAFYALHGLFHLLGMRDDDDADRGEMLRTQAKVMRDFGVDVGDGIETL